MRPLSPLWLGSSLVKISPTMTAIGTYETYGLGKIGSAFEVEPDWARPFTEV